ncbi:hypothetical protein DMC30DRAFT_125268 [Rhodotorula diobovata]|uniref:Uncharacterized protein n=1 Tax=Rhodotorula diobovata TaxID=5288 RepID=A0A5C5FND8_9BASI|nr:hypothetical protein DMC30DRAFT_125268 [Rhodotorula diobovata]
MPPTSAKAEQAKLAGNAAFKAAQWELALAHYSTAIRLDPSTATYPLNRAAVHLRLANPRDAERDATTALDLEGGHSPKALFRRATARKALGKLELARADFQEAKRQGAGDDVDRELAALAKQLGDAKLDKPASPAKANAAAKTTSPSTERLRAAIASPAPSSSPAKPAATDGFMTAVSSRRLTPSSPAPAPPAASPEPAAAQAPRAGASFAAKKEARAAKRSMPPRQAPASAAAEEEQTALAPVPAASEAAAERTTRPAPPPAPSQPAGTTAPAASAAAVSVVGPTPPAASSPSPASPFSNTAIPSAFLLPTSATSAPPPSATALETHFLLHPPPSPSRLALLRALDPSPASLRAFFGPGGVPPDLLSAILAEVLPAALAQRPPQAGEDNKEEEGEEQGWVARLLRGLCATRRWDSAVLFLEEGEREGVARVFEREEAKWKDARRAWGV